MPNLRIVSDNAIGRATLTASSTASAALAASNLLLDIKSLVHRATGTSVTYTATWATAEPVACVALPFCNLSPTATIRVRGYSDTAGTTQILDTGAVLACPAQAILLRGWTALASASAYAYGGGATARAWFTQTSVKCLVIDIVDTNNAAGYVEASRLVVGPYWSPVWNPEYGAPLTPVDMTKQFRGDAGDAVFAVGPRFSKLSLDLRTMPASDRTAMMTILRGNGISVPMFISLYPASNDLELERDHQIYGNLLSISPLSATAYNMYSAPIEIESI